MRDVVLGKEQVRVPVWLKIRIYPVALCVDFIIVAVEKMGGRISVDGLCHRMQRMDREHVIMIHQDNIFPRGQSQ
jgi:uncharacterized protein (DUF779 family)